MKDLSSKRQGDFISPLLIGWLIILGSYSLIRIVFLTLGFHQSSTILGFFLATVPYVLTAFYFWRTCIRHKTVTYIFGIIFPCVAEKIIAIETLGLNIGKTKTSSNGIKKRCLAR